MRGEDRKEIAGSTTIFSDLAKTYRKSQKRLADAPWGVQHRQASLRQNRINQHFPRWHIDCEKIIESDGKTLTRLSSNMELPRELARKLFGIPRPMFLVDHPYQSMAEGRAFLEQLPVSASDKERIAHGNAEKLFKL